MSRDASKGPGLPIVHEFASGIDVGARFHGVAVLPYVTTQPMQSFEEFTADLHRLADGDAYNHCRDGIDEDLLGARVRDS